MVSSSSPFILISGIGFSLDCLSYYCPVTVAIGLLFISMSSDGFLRLTFLSFCPVAFHLACLPIPCPPLRDTLQQAQLPFVQNTLCQYPSPHSPHIPPLSSQSLPHSRTTHQSAAKAPQMAPLHQSRVSGCREVKNRAQVGRNAGFAIFHPVTLIFIGRSGMLQGAWGIDLWAKEWRREGCWSFLRLRAWRCDEEVQL